MLCRRIKIEFSFNGILILILSFFVFVGPSFSSPNVCTHLFSQKVKSAKIVSWNFKGEEIELVEIHTKKGFRCSSEDLNLGENDLLIGFSVEGSIRAHIYLMVNNKRFDGRLAGLRGLYEAAQNKMSPGFVIVVKNIPQINRELLFEFIENDTSIRTLTCVQGACSVLFNFGALKSGTSLPNVSPAKFLSRISKKGLQGVNGENIKLSYYLINDTPTKFFKGITELQKPLPAFVSIVKHIFYNIFK